MLTAGFFPDRQSCLLNAALMSLFRFSDGGALLSGRITTKAANKHSGPERVMFVGSFGSYGFADMQWTVLNL